MEQAVFQRFRDLIYKKSGITLGPQKVALVSARVSKRMRALSYTDHRAYLKYVLADESGEELIHLLDAISTNVTSFFREAQHFDFLTQVIQKCRQNRQERFRFWSAASSTGEEPYTMGMVALEALKGVSCDLRILATDISTRVLEHCLLGHYTEPKLEPIPKAMRQRYFRRVDDDVYSINDDVRNLITFRRLNLSTPPFPMRGPMDIIFCRNVMIYFDEQIRRGFLLEAHRLLKPGGYLMIGHSESLGAYNKSFRLVKPSIYQKV